MKLFLKMNLAAVLIFTLSFSSCSKKDSTPKPDTKTLLTAKTWKVIEKAEDENKNGKLEAKEYHAVGVYELAEITFYLDGSGTDYFRGNMPIQWSLIDDQNMKVFINYVAGGGFFNWNIVKLTDTEFDFVETDLDKKNITYGVHCTAK